MADQATTVDYKGLVAGQRAYFKAGSTRPAAWRIEQLNAIRAMIDENRDDMYEALWHDLRRNRTDADLMDVDFNIRDFRTTYPRRPVTDERARAHYYGNLAVEAMQAKDTTGAVRYFRKTVEEDPTFTAAWVNLGSLYLRAGESAYARAAWHHALALDSNELVALSNLERLERHVGERRAALEKELAALRAALEEQREQLDVMRQKAELLATTGAGDDFASGDFAVGDAEVEVALLRERQKRQRS